MYRTWDYSILGVVNIMIECEFEAQFQRISL